MIVLLNNSKIVFMVKQVSGTADMRLFCNLQDVTKAIKEIKNVKGFDTRYEIFAYRDNRFCKINLASINAMFKQEGLHHKIY